MVHEERAFPRGRACRWRADEGPRPPLVKRRLRCLPLSLAIVGLLAFSHAFAEDTVESDNEFNARESPNFPDRRPADITRFLTGEAHFEGLIQFNQIWPDDSAIPPFHTIHGEGEARSNINFGRYFSAYSLLRLVRGAEQTTNSVFQDQVLYVQRLFGIVHLRPVDIYAGKIHPQFGIGWYATPGLYGTDYDSDYELVDKIGGGIRWDIRAFGRHRLTAEAFRGDTSFLAGSLIPGTVHPGLLNLQDGGVGYTDGFENFAIALNGQQMPGLPGLSYQIGWSRQKASPRDVRDETSWSIAALWPVGIFGGLTLEPMAEFVAVTGQGGADRDVNYLTLAATFRKGPWALALHTTQRYVSDFDAHDFRTDSLLGVAAAYELGDLKRHLPWLDGFTAIIGVRQSTTFGLTGQTIGAQLKYVINL